jgi:hypothetical protein
MRQTSRALSVVARAVRKVAACRHQCRVGYGHACSSGSDNAKFPFLATASRSFSYPITSCLVAACRVAQVARLSSDDRRPVSQSPGFRGRTDGLAIADITDRVGRKAVLIAHSTGMPLVVRAAGVHRETVSDVVLLEAPHKLIADDVRIHFISSGWFMLRTMIELPRLSKAF